MYSNFENINHLLFTYLILANLINLLLFYIDKRRARKGDWRVSESTFFYIALLGGSLGAIIAMKIFKHKTRRTKFKILLPLCFLLNILTLFYLQRLIK